MLELKIVFDTNVIYTGSSSDLFKKEIKELLEKNSSKTDIKLSWNFPEIVINERRFQMRKKGFELLPSIMKLERILGHNLNITEQIIISRINETISKQIEQNGINILEVDTTRVNWGNIIFKACNRVPPFEDSEKEKGFRDSLILETVLQLIESSPTAKSICRIIFITNDKLLQDAFVNNTKEIANVKLLTSLDELESLLNVLSSETTEELINLIIEKAADLFFRSDKSNREDTIYVKENIHKKIMEKFSDQLNNFPTEANKRENNTWWISKPVFLKKINQRIHFKTVITIDAMAYMGDKFSIYPYLEKMNKLTDPFGMIRTKWGSELEIETKQSPDILIANGKTNFEVIWSITVAVNKTLKNPKIEEINFIKTIWDNN